MTSPRFLFGVAVVLAVSAAACGRTPSESGVSSAGRAPVTSPAASASSEPAAAASSVGKPAADVLATSKGELTIHPVYHATLWFGLAGKTIVIDPWTKAGARLDAVPKADWVFLTDMHPDHLDLAALERVKKPGTRFITPRAAAEQVPGAIVMNNGEKRDEGLFAVEAIPMYNLVRGPTAGQLYHVKGRGNGYVFTFGDVRVYVSGDTECTDEVKALKGIDVAFVCMNLPYTMPPGEAAACVKQFRPKVLYPYHYRESNLGELTTALAGTGIETRLRSWY